MLLAREAYYLCYRITLSINKDNINNSILHDYILVLNILDKLRKYSHNYINVIILVVPYNIEQD